ILDFHVTGVQTCALPFLELLTGRMDFEFEALTRETIADIEAAINREVQAGRDVRVAILPRDEAFQIPDLIRTKINLLPEGIAEENGRTSCKGRRGEVMVE